MVILKDLLGRTSALSVFKMDYNYTPNADCFLVSMRESMQITNLLLETSLSSVRINSTTTKKGTVLEL